VALKPTHKKGLQIEICKPLKLLVRQAGFEPATYGFVVTRPTLSQPPEVLIKTNGCHLLLV